MCHHLHSQTVIKELVPVLGTSQGSMSSEQNYFNGTVMVRILLQCRTDMVMLNNYILI